MDKYYYRKPQTGRAKIKTKIYDFTKNRSKIMDPEGKSLYGEDVWKIINEYCTKELGLDVESTTKTQRAVEIDKDYNRYHKWVLWKVNNTN